MKSKFPDFCVACGGTTFVAEPIKGTFDYEHLGAQVKLSYSGNANKCLSCGLVTEGQDIFDARDRAVRAYLQLHTAQEIQNLRAAKNLSQAAFCKISRIGIASLRRWESGSLLPNPAMDSLLYLLLHFEDNLERLKQRSMATPSATASVDARPLSRPNPLTPLSEPARQTFRALGAARAAAMEREGRGATFFPSLKVH